MSGVTLTGLDDVLRRMREITQDGKNKAFKRAASAGAGVIKKAAVANAKKLDDQTTPENIVKNIVIRFNSREFRRTDGDIVSYRVGVLGGAKSPPKRKRARRGSGPTLAELGEVAGKGKANPGGDTFYWRFLEFGTKKMSAHPFMLQALESNQQQATDKFIDSLNRWLDKRGVAK